MSTRPTLLGIPDELFIKVLSSVGFLQLVRSQSVCKRFDHVVRSSGELQYIVELGVSGLSDASLRHPFNTFERLNYLKSRTLEWRDPSVEEITVISPPSQAHLWKLHSATLVRIFNRDPLIQDHFDVADVIRLDSSSAEQSGFSYRLDSQYTGFEFDAGQDLLVLFNRFPALPCSSVSFSLLSLDTGVPHPEAENNPLVVPCLGKYVRGQIDGLACTVWEETLVVQLFDGMAKFYFVNWRSGTVFANMLRKSSFARIHNLCRLGRNRFAFIEYGYHAWPQRYTLFIYSLDPQGNESSTPDHLATFNFPMMSLGTVPFTHIHSSFPPASRCHRMIHKKPNFVSHTSGVIQIRMVFARTTPPFGFQVFLLPDVLLRAAKGQDGSPSTHAWDEWGPANTRWIKDPLGRLTPTLRPYGYRVGLLDYILDFNPHEVGRDICRDGSVDEESPKSRVVREPSIVFASKVVRQNIVSSLPYRVTSCTLENMPSKNTLSYVDEGLYFVEFHRNGTATIHVCTI